MGVFNFSTSLNNVTYDEDGINLISSNKGDLSSFDFSEFTSSSSLLNNSGGESFLGNGTVGIGNGTATVAHLGRDEFLAKIEQLVLILIFIFTVAGNFLVLMGIYFRKEKMSRMYYFILHLAIADLTTAFFNVLTQLFWEMTHRFQGGAFMCKFVKYTQILGPYSSSYILVMTALDRYQAICYPLSNCSWTARRSKFMLGTAWTLAILFCLPQIYIFNYQEISHGAEVMVYDCWGTFAPDWGEKAYITWYCITIFIVPLIILVFAYTCITRAIWINFNMKNAVMKEERSGKRFTRDDSDEMDDGKGVHGGELDCTIVDDNESSICQDTTKVSSDKQSSMRNNGSVKAKNLEVSWHQTKQGTRTRASSIRKDETTGGNKRCQSYSGSHHQVPTTNLKRDSLSVIPNPRYFEKGKFFSDNSPCNDTKQRNNKCILLDENNETALLSSSTLMSKGNYGDKASFASQMNATTASHGCDTDKRHNGKILESADRKTQPHRWSSMSTKSGCLRAHFETGARDLDNKEVIQVKDGKSNFLTPLQNGSSSAAVSSHIKNRKRCSSKSSTKTMMQIQPRTHSVKGISRAKIKTVKLTVTVICCYIVCSTPFIAALLWSAYDPYAKIHPFWFGPTFTILTLLASLNSCVNSWIVLFFNPNLLQSFVRGICPQSLKSRSRQQPTSSNASTRKLLTLSHQNSKLMTKNSNQLGATSMTRLSPVMNRLSPNRNDTNRSKSGRGSMELISPPPLVNCSVSKNSKTSLSPEEQGQTRRASMDRNGKDHDINPIETSFIGI